MIHLVFSTSQKTTEGVATSGVLHMSSCHIILTFECWKGDEECKTAGRAFHASMFLKKKVDNSLFAAFAGFCK